MTELDKYIFDYYSKLGDEPEHLKRILSCLSEKMKEYLKIEIYKKHFEEIVNE